MLHLPYANHLPEGYSLRHLIAEYYGLTTWLDDTVGRMMAALESEGLSENTIVVFTSDHGDNLGSHGRVQKNFLNEESIRIPMIVRVPGEQQGIMISRQVANLVDLAPTLLSLAGGTPGEHMHGQDLSAVIRGDKEELPMSYSFIETEVDGIGVRTPTHIYGIPWSRTCGMLLPRSHWFFDLNEDPYELRNLAGTREQADTADELDQILRRWHGSIEGMDI